MIASSLVSQIFIKSTSSDVKTWNRIMTLGLILTFIIFLNSISITSIGDGIVLFNNWFIVESNHIFTIGIILLFTIMWTIYTSDNAFINLLILFNLIGLLLLPMINDLIVMYVVIELQSYSLYLLTGSSNRSFNSSKASLLYFLMGGIASIMILSGTYLIYADTGTTNLSDLKLIGNYTECSGYNLILFALFFKMGLAPLHKWSISVYNYAPTYITAYISIVAKISIISWIYTHSYLFEYNVILSVFYVSLAVSAYKPLFEINIKVLLAYSGMLNFAYLLLTIVTNDISFYLYLMQYTLTHFILFISILAAGQYMKDPANKWSPLLYYTHLYIPNRALILILIMSLLSLIGIPPFPGFYGKFYILIGALEHNYVLEVITIVIFSVIATYYYANIIKNLLGSFTKNKYNYYLNSSLCYVLSLSTVLLLSFYIYIPILLEGLYLITI